jgi:hypothetical protein
MDQALIEALYKVFAKYPIVEKIEGCPHCKLESAEKGLHCRPLRELTWDDLGVYPFKAMTTFGDVNDFKHFLPRILELHIKDCDSERYDFDVFLSKLKYAGWEKWEENERNTIHKSISSWLASLDPLDKENEYELSKYEEVSEALKEREIVIDV